MRRGPRRATILIILVALALASCTVTITRDPLPEALLEEARPLGLDDLRFWGDYNTPEEVERLMSERAALIKGRFADEFAAGITPELSYLALSGGGADGAFGAGILRAWSESGKRPIFQGVSGISTGALIAPFAYLGSEYDDLLEEFYTTTSSGDLLERTIFTGLVSGTALASTRGLRERIEKYITPQLLSDIAAEHAKGRLLFIGTTNLDAGRSVIWNMGEIAASGHSGALQLFRDVVLASASIPVAFPPVIIPVEAGGKTYDEMHVDGGATSQVTLISPQFPVFRAREQVGHDIDRELYVIINGRIVPRFESVRPRILSIGSASITSLLHAQSVGDLYKIYAVAERDDMNLYIAWLPDDFTEESEEIFDPSYMRALYDYGYANAADGNLWRRLPPYFVAPVEGGLSARDGHDVVAADRVGK